MKKTIVAITAAAFLGTAMLAAVPASATPLEQGPLPLPAIGLLPAMLVLQTKENKNFKPVNPYAHKRVRRHHH